MAAGKAYSEALRAAGVFVAGAGLEPPRTATTVSIKDGKRQVHDGPCAETKAFLAGFGIIEVPDLDAALEWAARHHAAGFARIEVRPLLQSRFLVAPQPHFGRWVVRAAGPAGSRPVVPPPPGGG